LVKLASGSPARSPPLMMVLNLHCENQTFVLLSYIIRS
jgi:hypothetical protein